jgi:thiol-disulfide isomerase/thioredoxin
MTEAVRGGPAEDPRIRTMTLLARVGLAIVRPRWAFAIAADRNHAGRSGSDLIVVIAILVAATQLRALFGAVWLGTAVGLGFGTRGVMHVLTSALTVDLAFLVAGTLVLWALLGGRSGLGRVFDLACAAALPLFVVDLVSVTVVRALEAADLVHGVPMPVGWALRGISWGWTGALLALARSVRQTPTAAVPAPPEPDLRLARRLGRGLVVVAAVGALLQVIWIARTFESMRPVDAGNAAPAFALPAIGPAGALGEPVTLASQAGNIVVVDFWATWCKPCLAAMPKLDALARQPGVRVLAIDLDDPAAARALFDARGYHMTLLADDGTVSERYGVSSSPHTVVIDATGVVRGVARGGGADIARMVEQIRK